MPVFSVSQVNKHLSDLIQGDGLLADLEVQGEVSNCKYHPSGLYFTLKDPHSKLTCYMRPSLMQRLSFELEDGIEVVCKGSVSVHQPGGTYSLNPVTITRVGMGQFHERFEALKTELLEMGMFSREYKKPIPLFPKTVGVLTSSKGDAVEDITSKILGKDPYVQIIVYPTLVQGEKAAPNIVAGIQALEKYGVDVMVLGRGGGTIEDLWCFNDRSVAEAIFHCKVPIITGIGHTPDTSIADFVADVWETTPTAAALASVPDMREVLRNLAEQERYLNELMRRHLRDRRSELQMARSRLEGFSPVNQLDHKKEQLVVLQRHLEQGMYYALQDRKDELEHTKDRLDRYMDKALTLRKHKLGLLIERMKGLSPLNKLSSGYSYVEDMNGNNIKSVEDLQPDQEIRFYMTDGTAIARVREISKNG
ncbi:MAG: exodeoxyribonuclease VII large subunit [Lachnospiraceae bacterium]|nr:exodeoxyribonuclease VII large subunit [Lachnospiraceae bacterium]